MKAPRHILMLALASIVLWRLNSPLHAQEPGEAPKPNLLDEMTALAGQIKVTVGGEHEAELVAKPVFRYDDQPRRILDATLWMWLDGGRPVMFQKIEAIERGEPRWSYCLTAFSTELISVEWPAGRQFRSTEPALVYHPVPGAPPVSARLLERRRQMRELARKFKSRIVLEDTTSSEMRLLTTPLYELAEPKTGAIQGAVFGFGTNGTNPDLLVLIEAQEDKDALHWQFAPARITTNGIVLKYDDQQVWETPHVNYKEAPFPTWTCFGVPRLPNPGQSETK